MKLVRSRLAHADTITTDDGIMLGIIYYQVSPIDDEGHTPAELFREWFVDVSGAVDEEWFKKAKEKKDHGEFAPWFDKDDDDAPPSAG